MARPTTYTDEIALDICARRGSGREPLAKICEAEDMPSVTTVYRWQHEHPAFQRLYETAQQDMAQTLADEILTISDDAPLIVEVDGQQITVKLDMAAVQRNRLRVDSRKWLASKLFKKKFGDQLAIGGAEELPPIQIDPIEGAKRLAFALMRADQLMQRPSPPPPLLAYDPSRDPMRA